MLKPVKIQVRFADCDMMGHVNNAVYLSYFEQARLFYFEQLVGKEWDYQKQGTLLVKNEVVYLKPVFLHDSPEISIHLIEIGEKSFRSEEHTSELQSRPHLVCRLLLEKKKKKKNTKK